MTVSRLSPYCSVHVELGSPSFVPGSRFTATLTIHAPPLSPATRLSAPAARNFSSLQDVAPSSGSTSAVSLYRPHPSDLVANEPPATVDYLVCEVAARWSAERAWVVQNVHGEGGCLDRANASCEGPDGKAKANHPWDAALADGSLVGGGGCAGYSGLVFRSPPHVVCEREQIPPGGQISFSLECVLPDCIPPTLRGTAIRYSYALIVVAAVRDPSVTKSPSVPRVIRVPFRVVAAGSNPSHLGVIPVPTPPHTGPRPNVFLEERSAAALDIQSSLLKTIPSDDIEIALALSLNGRLTPYPADRDPWRTNEAEESVLNVIRQVPDKSGSPASGQFNPGTESDGGVSGRNLSPRTKPLPVYSISRRSKLIAKMFMPKRVHRLGDTLSAIFDFTAQALPCYRLNARLEVQEIIPSKYALGTKQGGPVNDENGIVFRKIIGEHGEFVMQNRNTHVTFTIPHDAPVSFTTDAVRIKWFIHFAFFTPAGNEGDDNIIEDAGAAEDESEGDSLVAETTAMLLRVFLTGRQQSTEKSPVSDFEMFGIPKKDVDMLEWTLPLIVTGEPDWGTRASAAIQMT